MICKGTMQIKFIKKYPTSGGWRDKGGSGKYNINSTIKAMNLIMQGYNASSPQSVGQAATTGGPYPPNQPIMVDF